MIVFSRHRRKIPDEFSSIDKFRAYLGISQKELNYLRTHSKWLYSTSIVKKRSGGIRVLNSPTDRLKYIQRKILAKLEDVYIPRQNVHGFVKGRGVLSNASVHQKRPFLLNLDLKDYFGTVTYNRVKGVLMSVKIGIPVANAISALTVLDNKLPQGSPTSPILANMVSFGLDIALQKYAKTHNMRYTRFADDITLSSFIQPLHLFKDNEIQTGKVAEEVLSEEFRSIIVNQGFDLNPDKTWFSDRKLRKEVTGLTVNEFPNVPRKFVRNLRSSLHKISLNGLGVTEKDYHLKYKTNKPLKSVIRGRIDWVGQVKGKSDPVFRKLADSFNLLFPTEPILVDPTYAEIIAKSIWVIEWCEDVAGETITAQGTAFFLDGIGLVTAHHVLENLPLGANAEIYLPDNITEKYEAKLGKIFSSHVDVAELSHNIPAEKYLSLPASRNAVEVAVNIQLQ